MSSAKRKQAFPTHGDHVGQRTKKNLLTLFDYSPEEIEHLILLAKNLKNKRLNADPKVFESKTGVLIFEKPSLRTRITFEAAMYELGGHPIYLASDQIQMGKRESVEDVAKNLERWVHLIVARTFLHETVAGLAIHSSIPVINALSDKFHPCQALAFGLTVYERLSAQKGLKIVFVGDGNNVCHSLMVVAAKLGWHFIAAGPRGYEPDPAVLALCRGVAADTGAKIDISDNPAEAVRGATVIYTDVWTSMGQEKETAVRKKRFAPFQVNERLLSRAPKDVLVSHCLPAHRGEEITSGVLDSDHSIALDEAENRLHVQKAIIVHLFS
ncbi:MAG TPA: ornithine carbamoyltransferase [Chitinivibrionales bacterium]|nr:ornithine carbamoyltransferase [Chitinivibrionales bacterium]